MIDLCWKLAMVVRGEAPACLLETYEQDRLPVMRDVLFKTENLTGLIGSENPVFRALFNHVDPYIGGASLVQENSTARMSQIASNYRKSPLSEDHGHAGSLRAGDRVPGMVVRRHVDGTWSEATILSVLNPSHFVLLVAAPEDTTVPDDLENAVPEGRLARIAPAGSEPDRSRFGSVFGTAGAAVLVRPDAYAGLTTSLSGASSRVAD